MKKTYIIPECVVADVVVGQMLATSGVTPDGNVNPNNPGEGDGSDAAVKGNHNVWGDNWSE